MLSWGIPPLEIVARTLAVYALVLLGIKMLGKKEMGQMSAPDLVLVLLLANAVQNAMVGQDTSLPGGLLAAGVLLLLNSGLNALAYRNRRAEVFLKGVPVLLVHDGELIESHCKREHVTMADIRMALREHDIKDLSGVKSAVLEPNGSISLVAAGAVTLRSTYKVDRRE